MSTKGTRLTPGQIELLRANGIQPTDVGRIFNRAGTAPKAIPTSAAELEEMLGDPAQMQNVFSDKDRFKDFISNYARATMEKDTTIAAQVKEETQRVLATWLKENEQDNVKRLNLSPEGPSARSARGALYNTAAPGAAVDKDYKGSGDFFKAIWHNTDAQGDVGTRRRALRNALSSVDPGTGGFLIPETLRSELLQIALETAIVRPRARVIPMETLRVPFPVLDSTSNASSVFGGIVAYWTEEAAALVQSQPTFGRVVLEAKKLTAYCEVPNELLADSGLALQAFLDQILPEAIAWYEDAAFLAGTGVGEPLGALNPTNPAIVTVAKETSQATATLLYQNVLKMYARMLPASLGRAVWIISSDVFVQLAQMSLTVGTGGSAVWMSNGAEGAPAMTLFGRPVIVSEKVSSLGTQGDINFVDFGHYLVGDRQSMSAESSPHYRFANDVTAFRIIERVDGRPWLQSAITPKNGGSTLSPYVQLAARP